MSAIISDTDFQSDIKSFKQVAQKTNLKSSIGGITVNGTGLPINGIEFAERSANLHSVQNLEEQERDRRIAEDSNYQQLDFSRRLRLNKMTSSLEELERSRRIADVDGSEEYRELLAHKVTGSISKDILSQSSKLRSIARGAIDSAKHASQDIIHSATGLAQRAVDFFGQKVAAINENLHDISGKAVERAQEFGGQASELTDKAFDKVQDLTGKAVLQAQNLKMQAQDHAEDLSVKAASTAQQMGEKAIHFGTQKYGDALRLIAIGKLDFAEETERQYRTTIGLSVDKFLLALRTSALIREHWTTKGHESVQYNSWYGTGIVEEFERRRRIQHDQSHTTSKDNAKKIGQLVHLRNIQTESYRPQVKQLEKVSAVVDKKAEEIRATPIRAMAAM